jgi:hypothetical protein
MAIFQKCGPRADLGWPWLADFDHTAVFLKTHDKFFSDM